MSAYVLNSYNKWQEGSFNFLDPIYEVFLMKYRMEYNPDAIASLLRRRWWKLAISETISSLSHLSYTCYVIIEVNDKFNVFVLISPICDVSRYINSQN